MTDNLKGWEQLEAYLFDHKQAGTKFTVHDYAGFADLEVSEGSAHIQGYLDEQRQTDRPSKALFTLSRVPGTRTRSAVWRWVSSRTTPARSARRSTTT